MLIFLRRGFGGWAGICDFCEVLHASRRLSRERGTGLHSLHAMACSSGLLPLLLLINASRCNLMLLLQQINRKYQFNLRSSRIYTKGSVEDCSIFSEVQWQFSQHAPCCMHLVSLEEVQHHLLWLLIGSSR